MEGLPLNPRVFRKRSKFHATNDNEDEDSNDERDHAAPKRKKKEINPDVPKHHIQQELCHHRPPYRQGKKFTAVKVYTVNDESQHLIIKGVPKINLIEELAAKFAVYGTIKKLIVLPDYPCEEFTEAYHVHYARIQSARIAKRMLDGFNFYGGIFHIFYAPEFETISETRQKLLQRRRDIAIRIKRLKDDPTEEPKEDDYEFTDK